MLSPISTVGVAAPPGLERGSAVVARPWCTSTTQPCGGVPGALAPTGKAGAAGPFSGATYVPEPYAQIRIDAKFQPDKNAHFAQMTRIAPAEGGALGSHPARDPV